MRRPSRRIWIAAAACAAGAAVLSLVLVHRSGGEVVFSTARSPLGTPMTLTAGTGYHIAIESDHCPTEASLDPAGRWNNVPRSIDFHVESATNPFVRHVDQDFRVTASGTYQLLNIWYAGAQPDPDHPCRFTATITKA